MIWDVCLLILAGPSCPFSFASKLRSAKNRIHWLWVSDSKHHTSTNQSAKTMLNSSSHSTHGCRLPKVSMILSQVYESMGGPSAFVHIGHNFDRNRFLSILQDSTPVGPYRSFHEDHRGPKLCVEMCGSQMPPLLSSTSYGCPRLGLARR